MGDNESALSALRQATTFAPDYAAAWNDMGGVLSQLQRHSEAASAFRRAIAAAPDLAIAHKNLGGALKALHDFPAARVALEQAIALQPHFKEALCELAVCLKETGQLRDALRSYDAAIALDPNFCEAHVDRAICHLLLGHFAQGWADFEWRLKRPEVSVFYTQPRWNGEALAGRTLLLESEQGIGDTIQFIRYAAEVKSRHNARIIVACNSQLKRLVSTAPGIDAVVASAENRPDFDVWLPLMSFPWLYGHDSFTFPSAIPYLSAEANRIDAIRAQLNGIREFKVGIAWQGDPLQRRDWRRSMPLDVLLPLTTLPGIKLFSLQKRITADIAEVISTFNIIPLPNSYDAPGESFIDTAALIMNLDLVITIDTSIAHLAGALGAPTWVVLADIPDWRWNMDGVRTPWYPSMRLFRQTHPEDWAGVLQSITTQLRFELCNNSTFYDNIVEH
jgi:tetratricopeptide (TPR) repeat protein